MNLEAIKEQLDNPAAPHYRMNAKTWQAYRREYYHGRRVPPNALRCIWIDADPKFPDGECLAGPPNTGWPAPLD